MRRINSFTRLNRPMSAQPFRPGQWNGVRVGGNRTYIQNNFFGADPTYRGWGDAWASYDYGDCDCGSNKIGIMGWIGLGTGLLGTVLQCFSSIFGGGGGGGSNDTPQENTPSDEMENMKKQIEKLTKQNAELQAQLSNAKPAQNNNDNKVKANNNSEDKAKINENKDAPKAATTKSTAQNAADNENKVTAQNEVNTFDWSTVFETWAADVDENNNPLKNDKYGNPLGKIDGKVKVTSNYKADSKTAPKTFTITSDGTTYSFEKVDTTDGSVKYRCNGSTGAKRGTQIYQSGQEYLCEMINGKPHLLQKKGMEGWEESLQRTNGYTK